MFNRTLIPSLTQKFNRILRPCFSLNTWECVCYLQWIKMEGWNDNCTVQSYQLRLLGTRKGSCMKMILLTFFFAKLRQCEERPCNWLLRISLSVEFKTVFCWNSLYDSTHSTTLCTPYILLGVCVWSSYSTRNGSPSISIKRDTTRFNWKIMA